MPGPTRANLRWSLWLRWSVAVTLLVTAVMAAVLLLLGATGVFSAGTGQAAIYAESESAKLAQDVSRDFGTASAGGVKLSHDLARQIATVLEARGATWEDLRQSPGLQQEVLAATLDLLVQAIHQQRISGAYLVLDATVNPGLADATSSRAGLFLRNAEPNAAVRTDPSLQYLRGPMDLARQRGLSVLPQWKLEFTVGEGDFFRGTLADVRLGLDASRLYRWHPAATLHGDFDEAMLLAVPIVTAAGEVYGVCGLEVNAMLFKLAYAPDDTVFRSALNLLAPTRSPGELDLDAALVARHRLGTLDAGRLPPGEPVANLERWPGFFGRSAQIALYPKDSIHAGQGWVAATLLPEAEVRKFAAERNFRLGVPLAVLLVVALGAGIVVARGQAAPLRRALTEARDGRSPARSTRIREIDDLFAFLAAQDAARPAPPGHVAVPEPQLTDEEFRRRLLTLTRAETAVFNLYAAGYDAQEVASLLFLSINTIKTHNKRIYHKLGVASRKELLAHLRAIRASGERASPSPSHE
jgi:DNA-binding CsgD family transcriptional regulator